MIKFWKSYDGLLLFATLAPIYHILIILKRKLTHLEAEFISTLLKRDPGCMLRSNFLKSALVTASQFFCFQRHAARVCKIRRLSLQFRHKFPKYVGSVCISVRQEGKMSRNELTGNLPWSSMLEKPFIFEIKVTSNYFWPSKVLPLVPPFSSF